MSTTTDEQPQQPEVLTPEQRARIKALKEASGLLSTSKGFAAREPGELGDLVDLALFILTGRHPLEDYRQEPCEHRWRTMRGMVGARTVTLEECMICGLRRESDQGDGEEPQP